MKRLASFLLMVMLGMATMQAQTVLPEPVNNNSNENMPIEYAELSSDVSASLENLVDASFLTESNLDYTTIDLTSNPKKEVAALLSIFLGDFGIGHFYTGQTTRGILDIVFCWTGIPAIIGLVEGIIWFFDTDEEWAARVAEWNSNK